MSITFVVYDCNAQPTHDDILEYVGAISEFSEKLFQGVPFQIETHTEFPEIGKTLYGTLFQINDVRLHSDDFYIVASKAFTELFEPDKADEKTVETVKGYIANEITHWLEHLNGNVVDTYYTTTGKHVTHIKGETTYFTDLFSLGLRRGFKMIKGEKK